MQAYAIFAVTCPAIVVIGSQYIDIGAINRETIRNAGQLAQHVSCRPAFSIF